MGELFDFFEMVIFRSEIGEHRYDTSIVDGDQDGVKC